MDLSKNPDWRLTKSFLVILGLWPFHQTYLQTILSSIAIIAIISIVLPEAIKISSVWGDVNAFAECAPLLSLHMASMLKMLSYYSHLHKFKKILEDIQRDWSSDLSDLEMKILQHYGQINRRSTRAYAYVILGCTIAALSAPLAPKVLDYVTPLNESRATVFLYSVEYFVDPEKYKVLIFIHAYLISPFPTLITVAFDTTYFHCVQHGCSMFAVMRHRIQSITNESGAILNRSVNTDKKVHRLLTNCIRKHVHTLQYCDKLESLFSFVLLPIIIINTLALSITGFHTLIKLNNLPEALRFGAYTFGLVIHIFLYAYVGQDLTDHSESIHRFTYDTQWYNISPKLKGFFILAMIRSNNTCKITAGKFYVLSIENFGKVIKLSVSYFTALLSFQ